jgi:hypothetical protein
MNTTMRTRLYVAALGLSTACVMASVPAKAESLSDASRASIDASVAIPVTLVRGSVQLFRDAGQFSVTSVKTVGDVSVIALRGLADGAEATVRISGKVIEGSAIAAGVVVQATVSATGVLLVAAGKALMFIPNEVGRSLLHHSRSRETGGVNINREMP